MKKILLTFVFAVALALTASAQQYKDACGISFGPSFKGGTHYFGVQWNHFLNEKNNLDIRLDYTINWGPSAEAMYEWNFPIKDSDFRFYAGPGVHFGFVSDYDGAGNTCVAFGFTGAAGAEYAFPKLPLAISLDWRPFLTWQPAIDSSVGFGYALFTLGVKYCF